MASLADRTIARIRALQVDLVSRASSASDDELGRTSGATEWSVAQVLSHFGSQAEIALVALPALLTGGEAPSQDFNESVWARWNSLGDRAKAENFIEHSSALLAAVEAVPDRETRTVTLPFLPYPLPWVGAMGMRLNEYALHHWDVVQGLDGHAHIDEESAALLAQHLGETLSFMLRFTAKADLLAEPAVVEVADLHIVIGDGVSIDPSATPTAVLDAPLEAGIRLLSGRLREEVPVKGNVTLDDLRKVFPGY